MSRTAKRVNMNNVSVETIDTFNAYFVSITDTKDEIKSYNDKIAKCDERIEAIKAQRAEAQAEGLLTFDEIVEKYDMSEVLDEKAGLTNSKKELSKSRAKAEREAARYVSDEMFDAYKVYSITGGHNAMRKACEDFLAKAGVEFTEKTSAEFCNRLVATFGRVAQNNTEKIRSGEFTKMYKKDAFFKLAMRAILETMVSYGALEIKDGKLVKVVFEEQA